jgi:hypothetical protein
MFANDEHPTRMPATWPKPDASVLCGEEQLGGNGRGANEEDIEQAATKMPDTTRALFPLTR